MGKKDIKSADVEELREYREAKASGRLFVIPEGLKDGDTVWYLRLATERISSHMIIEWVIVTGRLFGKIAVEDDYMLFSPDDIGVDIYRTKEEAEEALEAWRETMLIADEVGVSQEEEDDSVCDNRKNL